jgi:hypothetical protein
MLFMNLTRLSDFLQAIIIKRRLSTKNYYFSKHIQFTTIYLPQKQKLKHNNYFKHNINMSYFVQAIESEMSMHAKFGYLILYEFL